MQIRIIASLSFTMLLLGSLLISATSNADEGLKLEALLYAELQSVSGIEVIVSRVTIPPNTSLRNIGIRGRKFPMS